MTQEQLKRACEILEIDSALFTEFGEPADLLPSDEQVSRLLDDRRASRKNKRVPQQ